MARGLFLKHSLWRRQGRQVSNESPSGLKAGQRYRGGDVPFTSWELAERMLHRRAVEAVIWGMPLVNFDLMFRAMAKAGGDWNQVAYWSRLPDWKIQTLTPNPDVIYLTPFINTKEAGPMVLEIPPAEEGSIT